MNFLEKLGNKDMTLDQILEMKKKEFMVSIPLPVLLSIVDLYMGELEVIAEILGANVEMDNETTGFATLDNAKERLLELVGDDDEKMMEWIARISAMHNISEWLQGLDQTLMTDSVDDARKMIGGYL